MPPGAGKPAEGGARGENIACERTTGSSARNVKLREGDVVRAMSPFSYFVP